MEMISSRVNHTKINRAISFRGFVPDSPGHGKDRLYTVVDARIEKAEQNISTAMQPTEALLLWSFAQTEERFEISGLLSNIKAHLGNKEYGVWDARKAPAAAEDEGQLHLRRIAWNACSDAERAAFRFPSTHDDSALFPAAADSRRAVGLMRRALQALCIDPRTQELRDPAAVFRAMDRDGGGTLNPQELREGLRASKAALTDEEAGELFAAMDPARTGEVPRRAPPAPWPGRAGGAAIAAAWLSRAPMRAACTARGAMRRVRVRGAGGRGGRSRAGWRPGPRPGPPVPAQPPQVERACGPGPHARGLGLGAVGQVEHAGLVR